MENSKKIFLLLLLFISNCAMTFATESGFVYVVNNLSKSVSVIDTATHGVIDIIDVGESPECIAIAPDGSFAYVTNKSDCTVSVIDTFTHEVEKTITVGKSPAGVAIASDQSFAYVVNMGDNTISFINTTDHAVQGESISVGTTPIEVAIAPDGSFTYVTNKNSATVSIIDNNGVGSIPVDANPVGVAIDTEGSFALVTHEKKNKNGKVSVINTADHTVSETVKVGDHPVGVAIAPDQSFAYVANRDEDSVSLIDIDADANTYKFSKTIDVETKPTSVAIFLDAYAPVDNTDTGADATADTGGDNTNTVATLYVSASCQKDRFFTETEFFNVIRWPSCVVGTVPTYYKLYRDSALIFSGKNTTFTDHNVGENHQHVYLVEAINENGVIATGSVTIINR